MPPLLIDVPELDVAGERKAAGGARRRDPIDEPENIEDRRGRDGGGDGQGQGEGNDCGEPPPDGGPEAHKAFSVGDRRGGRKRAFAGVGAVVASWPT